MKKNQKGFSVVEGLLIVVVVGLIAAVGWLVYDRQKNKNTPESVTSNTQGTNQEATSPAAVEVTIPAGWVEYKDTASKLSFYHPAAWKNADISVDTYSTTESIPSKYGTPDSVAYDAGSKSWATYLNYGTQYQQKFTNDGLKTITVNGIEAPVAYKKMAHASVATYDIYVVNNGKAYRIRLPQHNSFDNQNWEADLKAQLDAIPNLVPTIKFS